ncbi:unnamed protein product [Orchesella dallaii]|uniref:Thioester reductase (TE) domain-containing protein n=1 Tax=Orchesella dallaii TaxID=48710 RepID=A0ABP1RMG3_9HEXA
MQEMGVDSLMFVEIKNGLQTLLGERFTLSASSLKDANTVNLLSSTLVGLIEGAPDKDLASNMKLTSEEVTNVIREDSHLPEQIRVKAGQVLRNVEEIQTVLLTGCTGTLGPYILKELTSRPQITEVVCLIRPSKSVPSVEERLRNVLSSCDLLSKMDMKKVRCVSGNVAEPNLGLKPDVWSELSKKVDAIINCAACVVHSEQYRKTTSQNDMRAVNIGGIKNVLEFACENKLKYVYHASTLVTAANIDEDSGRLSEKWPEIEDFENVTTLGYPITKFVADVLIKEAVTRGIPAKIFRLPLIVGELETGRCSIAKNHVLLRYLFIMKHGMMPSLPMPMSMLPVDTCAEVTLRLFLDGNAPLGIYNIAHANPDVDQAFVEIAKRFGRHVDVVESEEFVKQVLEADSGDGFSAFKEFYTNDDAMVDFFSSPTLKKWLEGNELKDHNIIWRSSKVESILLGFYERQACQPTMEFVYRNLSFLKSQGLFEKLGL